MTIRISVTSINQTRSATWYTSGAVTITDASGAPLETRHADTRAEFDALCMVHGIESVGRGTQRKKALEGIICEPT